MRIINWFFSSDGDRLKFSLLFSLLIFLGGISSAQEGVDRDLQNWDAIRLTVPINPKWSVSMQNEIRLADDISSLDEYIFKLYAHHVFSEKFGLSFGYKFIDRPNGPNEQEPWGEAVWPHTYNKWQISHQVRFEARFYQGLDGILPRVRYLFNWTRQLGDSFMYVTGFSAIRFNLAQKDAGPVAGFEQVRVNANLGFHLGEITRLELGYLYRYEISRDLPDLSDNTIHLNLFITLKRKGKAPLPNDHLL
jgi:hypothetical protein